MTDIISWLGIFTVRNESSASDLSLGRSIKTLDFEIEHQKLKGDRTDVKVRSGYEVEPISDHISSCASHSTIAVLGTSLRQSVYVEGPKIEVKDFTATENVPTNTQAETNSTELPSDNLSEVIEPSLNIETTPRETPETLQLQSAGPAEWTEIFSLKGMMDKFSWYKDMLLSATQEDSGRRVTPTENVVVDRTPSPVVSLDPPGPSNVVSPISDPDVFERLDDSSTTTPTPSLPVLDRTTTNTTKSEKKGVKSRFKRWFNLKVAENKSKNSGTS